MFSLTSHPLKAIYTILALLALPFRVIYTSLYYLPRSQRPHQRWTYHQAVGKALFEMWWNYASRVEYRTTKTLLPGADGKRFIVMPACDPEKYRDALKDERGAVKPAAIGGMWFLRLYKPETNKRVKVAIHFHGGAFVLGGCRPMQSGWGPEVLAKSIQGFVLQPQYRLAVYPDSHFPAPLQDGLTAYSYLLSQGVLASDIWL